MLKSICIKHILIAFKYFDSNNVFIHLKIIFQNRRQRLIWAHNGEKNQSSNKRNPPKTQRGRAHAVHRRLHGRRRQALADSGSVVPHRRHQDTRGVEGRGEHSCMKC